ncbi:butyrophilin subfamily 1 member A1 isoform X2 [Chelonia mydas]|uniref:butyrophilin subfamily 1 member A1 isoform X2 n=1 Tax=Chelonia mydas TaxID=8469 RepID=UPI001CA8BD3A|nr:butyrophilin subfamily 1 member A1 isoform X2 [Chelonia mydas]
MELQGQLSSRLFCAILLAVIPFSESFEVISSPTVTGIVGQDVVLPCQVSTGMQPAKMEVQWKKIIPAARETVHEYRAQPGQDVPGPNYQGRTMLLKDGFTLGNVSLKLKNVRPADRGMYSCIVKSNEWSADAATELQIAETSEEKTEKMAEALVVLVVVLIVIIIIGIIFIYYYLRNRRRDPEKGTLISAEQGHRVGWSQNQDELQGELRRIQEERDELQGELNWRRTYKYADDITLDAGTAHPNFSIAGDQKSLKHEAQPEKVLPNPERFDSTVCVLGSEGFSSGKHYWEVDVMSSTDWDLGVARKSIQRKGKLSLSPKEGFWALGLSGRDYWARTDPWTRVMVQKKPKKIGVYLSYQDKQVTFFSVTDRSVLFTFNNCSFSGAVYPFLKNSHKETAMRICSIREDE